MKKIIHILLKTPQVLEEKAWYRLLKVIYLLIIGFVIFLSVSIYIETFDRGKIFIYSQDQINKMKDNIKTNGYIMNLKKFEEDKNKLDGKQFKEKVEDKTQDEKLILLIALKNAGYSLSGADFRKKCSQYDDGNIYDVFMELESFSNGGFGRFCQNLIGIDIYENSEQVGNIFKQGGEVIKNIQEFENNPSQANMFSLTESLSNLSEVDITDIGTPNNIHYLYIVSKVPLLSIILLIEYLIFFLLIPKVFFYIILGK